MYIYRFYIYFFTIRFANNWFRAVVKAVDQASNRVIVFFVDYGATEIVLKSDNRRKIIFQEVPVQTFNGRLLNAKIPDTLAKNGDWPEAVLDRVYELVVNKVRNIHIVSFSPLQVSVQHNKCQGQSTNADDLTDLLALLKLVDYESVMEKDD